MPCNPEAPLQHNLYVAAQISLVADILLVDRCTSGEEAAARELFRHYHKRVHGTLYRILGSTRDIDDLTQDTFIQIFKSLAKFRAEAKLSTWIDRITVRVAYRYIGKRKRLAVPDDTMDEIESPRPGPGQQAQSREGVRRLYAALAQLAPASRIAFALHEIDGRSVAEVATLVGASQSACKLRIWRARRMLFKLASSDPILAELLDEDELDAAEVTSL